MKVALGDQVYEVESRVEGNTLRLVVNGVAQDVPFLRLPDGRVRLTISGQTVLGWSDGKFANVNGRTRDIRQIAPGAKAPAASLSPPMPAVVTAVLVKPGDSVEAGQKLLLLSAMKTEIAIRAPRAGTVEHVHVVVGQQVAPGPDLLILS